MIPQRGFRRSETLTDSPLSSRRVTPQGHGSGTTQRAAVSQSSGAFLPPNRHESSFVSTRGSPWGKPYRAIQDLALVALSLRDQRTRLPLASWRALPVPARESRGSECSSVCVSLKAHLSTEQPDLSREQCARPCRPGRPCRGASMSAEGGHVPLACSAVSIQELRA